MKPRILVAGIGNIFFGDDGFGCEVAQQMSRKNISDSVRVIDFGIRSYDLAYALTEGYDAVILIDAMARGEAPGTVSVVEPDLTQLSESENAFPDGHSLNPVSVLQMAQTIGSLPEKLFLIACDPAVLDVEELGLSETVRAAIPRAIEEIESLVTNLLSANRETNICPAAA